MTLIQPNNLTINKLEKKGICLKVWQNTGLTFFALVDILHQPILYLKVFYKSNRILVPAESPFKAPPMFVSSSCSTLLAYLCVVAKGPSFRRAGPAYSAGSHANTQLLYYEDPTSTNTIVQWGFWLVFVDRR